MRKLLPGLMIVLFAPWAVGEDKKEDAKLDLFPLASGTKWEYEVSVGGQVKAVIQEVTKITPGKKGERDIVTLTTKVEEQTIVEEMSADEKALYRHAFQGMKLESPLTVLKYPYKAGAKWKESIKIAKEEAEANFETFKAEEVKVAAGKYTAYPVVMEMDAMGQKVTSKNWYADGVGMVKQEVSFPGVKVTMELKKFTKGK